MLARSKAIPRAQTVGLEPQRCGQHGKLLGNEGAKRPERGLGLEPGTHRPHLGDAPGELLGEQPNDDAKDVMDQTHPALDPAHRPRELDRIAAQRIARRSQARGLLGVGHYLFDLVELPRKPCGQTIGQQTEGGVALRAVPASDLRPARALARVGAVACQRTSPVRVVRTARKPCIAPRPGSNVLPAGEPRLVAKLQPAVARRGRSPARAFSFGSQRAPTLRRARRRAKRDRRAVPRGCKRPRPPADGSDPRAGGPQPPSGGTRSPDPCEELASNGYRPARRRGPTTSAIYTTAVAANLHRRRKVPGLLRHPG